MDAAALNSGKKFKHDIRPAEICDWASKKWPLDLCKEVADQLNKMRWAGEPSGMPELKENEIWVRDAQFVDGKAVVSPWRAELDPESEYEDELDDLVQAAGDCQTAAPVFLSASPWMGWPTALRLVDLQTASSAKSFLQTTGPIPAPMSMRAMLP